MKRDRGAEIPNNLDQMYQEYLALCKEHAQHKRIKLVEKEKTVYGEFPGFKCHRCHHSRIRFVGSSVQMRAADEPAHVNIECERCRHISFMSEA